MKKFYQFVVNSQNAILILFLTLTVLSFLVKDQIRVDYDMTDYLPAESSSTISLDKMEEEYSGGIPNARVMIRDVTIPEALDYKEKLKDCTGVDAVTWLDDSLDVTQPLETLDTDTVETYYLDGTALYSLTLDEDLRVEAVDAIRELIGDENAMSGNAVSTAIATTSTVDEIRLIAAIAVIVVWLALTLTTGSWIEPFVVLGGLGVAIMLNSGSNLMFGEISFVSNAAGAILQLAVSLDYSVFLIHRFQECLSENPNRKEAMVEALCKSTMSIMSSGLTTVIGFLALCFMRFGIGPDLGLVLAKGVSISLITVFLFMPALILKLYPLMGKTKHRPFYPDFHFLGKWVRRGMIPAVIVFAAVLVPAYLASNANSYYYGSSHIFGTDTQAGQDAEAIEEVFGKTDTYVVMVPNGSTSTQLALSDVLHEIPQVKSILSYVDTVGKSIPEGYLSEDTLSLLVSEHYSRFVLTVDADYEGDETFDLVKTIRETVSEYYPDEYYLAGEGVSTYDLMDTITADMATVNLIAIAAVFVTLLFSLKSISLPVILVTAIETAIFINMAVPWAAENIVFYISYLIISSIQLGATVDYAILFTDRFLEFRQKMSRRDAVVETVATVAVSIFTSGTVMAVVGFLLGGISTHGILSQLGTFLGRGTLLSMAVVFFALPGLLCLFDGLIQHTTKGIVFYKENAHNGGKDEQR